MVIRYILLILSLLSPISLLANDRVDYCPLTSEYLISQLNKIENLPITSKLEHIAPLQSHSIRMATEALTSHIFKNNKECEYFFISVNLKGMESEKMDVRIYNYNELLTHVKKCKKWITNKFPEPKKELESLACK